MTDERRTLKFYQADVFTNLPFGGNPVAVVPDAVDLGDQELQVIAREMNLSETVFILPPADPAAALKIRIFTPTQEIPFAGHPVLGACFVLGKLKRLTLTEPITRILYECNIGVFPVELHSSRNEILRVVMSQPNPEFLGRIEAVEEIFSVANALGISKTVITETKFPIEIVSTGLPVMIVPVRTLTAVTSVVPNVTAINELCARYGTNGMMVFTTMTVEESAAVHTRMFACPIGVMEDPATGSASGALGAYLVKNGVMEKSLRTEVIAEQGYEIDRPSRIVIQVESDDDKIRSVKVGGQAVMIIEGTLTF
ncbi:MAG: PhzF family phenazine biosynthesis protein [Nitrospiraceae bacterium]|nr:PhzF family phenazine biosynthesis protein [Nitrospiraceae bacterium]